MEGPPGSGLPGRRRADRLVTPLPLVGLDGRWTGFWTAIERPAAASVRPWRSGAGGGAEAAHAETLAATVTWLAASRHDAIPPEVGDRRAVVPEAAEHLVRVLAELRRGRQHSPGRPRHLDRERDLRHQAELRVLDRREEAPLDQLRVADDLVQIQHRPRAHIGLVEQRDPLGAGPRPEQPPELLLHAA